jgi:DNA-directed RNA polymerase specialized sigma24 family protein
MLRLYKDTELARYIEAQARRHFSCREDREDVISEVWEKLAMAGQVRPGPDARHLAYRTVKNAYDRMLYRRKRAGTVWTIRT